MRTPLVWHNILANKSRTAASLVGVSFAMFLSFMQLGFYDLCLRSSTMIYDQLDFDIALVSPQYAHLRAANSFPRHRLFQAKEVPGVASAVPLYINNTYFRNPRSRSLREIVVLAVPPRDALVRTPGLKDNLHRLLIEDTAIMDVTTSKGYDPVGPGTFTELENRRIEIVATYAHGSGFISDASIVVSDRTLSRIFGGYSLELVNVGLVKLSPGANVLTVARKLQDILPADVRVWNRSTLEEKEQVFFVRKRPLGIMFSSGVVLALAVGAVILYETQAAEIANKVKEYATLKAIGYSNAYMNWLVLQQACLFAFLGFIPALIASLGFYRATTAATNLPMIMTPMRIVFVLVMATVMCCISGILACLKVARADPADLY
jgi:putative ABC transport system permease protein